MRRPLIYVLVVLLTIAGFVGYNYIYQDHRDIQQEEAFFNGSASNLKNAYKAKPSEFLNKTLIVTGEVTAAEANGLTLDQHVFASFNSNQELPEVGSKITLKARCIGYDELFELVSLDQAKSIK